MMTSAERAEHLDRVRRLVFATANSFGLTRGDRLAIATEVLNREVDTYSSLDYNEWHRLADAFGGARAVAGIFMARREQHAQSQTTTATERQLSS